MLRGVVPHYEVMADLGLSFGKNVSGRIGFAGDPGSAAGKARQRQKKHSPTRYALRAVGTASRGAFGIFDNHSWNPRREWLTTHCDLLNKLAREEPRCKGLPNDSDDSFKWTDLVGQDSEPECQDSSRAGYSLGWTVCRRREQLPGISVEQIGGGGEKSLSPASPRRKRGEQPLDDDHAATGGLSGWWVMG